MTNSIENAERLLILDDTVELANLIGEIGRGAGFETHVTTDIEDFYDALKASPPSIIVLDLQMPKADGVEVLRYLAAEGATAGVLLVTGMDRRTIESAERFGRKSGLNMLGSLQKPFEPERLLEKLASARNVTRQLTGDDLATAIDDSALKLHFQPVVRRLQSGMWHAESVEALPRWQHPVLGLLTPGDFLSLAGGDRGTLMRRLTDFVLQRGIEQLRIWQSQGLHLGLRVNVAVGLVSDTQFPDRLEQFIDEHHVDPSLLTLELSDAGSLGTSRDGIEILTRLRLKEINLALDDFGAAGQSIESLCTLPISEVKIDNCVIRHLATETVAPTLVQGIVDIAHNLDIACCAEGVETAEQLLLLDRIGCDLAQGYYIGAPVRAQELAKIVDSWTASMPHAAKANAK